MNQKQRLATVISRIFDPFIMLTLFLVLTFMRGGVTSLSVWLLACVMMIAVPVLLIIFAIKKHIVSNWDMSRRSERPFVLGVLLIVEGMSITVLSQFVAAQVTHTLLFLLGAIFGYTLVTLRWKISGHAFTNALTAGTVIAWYGWQYWPILLIVPLVSWARVVRGDHTVAQVIAGAAYPWILLALLGSYFI